MAQKARLEEGRALGTANSGVFSRAARDEVAHKAEEITDAKIAAALSAKSQRYDELRRAGTDAGDETSLVDFERKALDARDDARARASRAATEQHGEGLKPAAAAHARARSSGSLAPGPAEHMHGSSELVACVGCVASCLFTTIFGLIRSIDSLVNTDRADTPTGLGASGWSRGRSLQNCAAWTLRFAELCRLCQYCYSLFLCEFCLGAVAG